MHLKFFFLLSSALVNLEPFLFGLMGCAVFFFFPHGKNFHVKCDVLLANLVTFSALISIRLQKKAPY